MSIFYNFDHASKKLRYPFNCHTKIDSANSPSYLLRSKSQALSLKPLPSQFLDPGRRLSPFCRGKTQLSYSTFLRNVSIRLAAALSWACVPQRYFTRSPSSFIDGSLTTSKAGHENKTCGVDSTTNPHRRQEYQVRPFKEHSQDK